MVVLQSRCGCASLPEVVDVSAAAPISQGDGNLHILWNVPRNLLVEDVALDESHRCQIGLFTCFGDDAYFVTLVPEHVLLNGSAVPGQTVHSLNSETLEEVVDLAEPPVQEVVVVAESATNNPAFLPTPSIEIRALSRGRSVRMVGSPSDSVEPWWPWID